MTIFWDKEKLAKADPKVQLWTHERKSQWLESYRTQFLPLFRAYPKYFRREDYPENFFLWALSAVQSRNWVVGRTKSKPGLGKCNW